MPLIEKIFLDADKRWCGIPEKGRRIYLGLPTSHLESFYTDASYERKMSEEWDENLQKFREKLLTLAREDENLYYYIPEKPTETSKNSIRFVYNTFEKIE